MLVIPARRKPVLKYYLLKNLKPISHVWLSTLVKQIYAVLRPKNLLNKHFNFNIYNKIVPIWTRAQLFIDLIEFY